MSTVHRFHRAAVGLALVLAGTLIAPLAVMAEEQVLVVMPAAPSWDASSGYGSIEASRAAASTLLPSDPAWDVTSGYGSVEASRAHQ